MIIATGKYVGVVLALRVATDVTGRSVTVASSRGSAKALYTVVIVAQHCARLAVTKARVEARVEARKIHF